MSIPTKQKEYILINITEEMVKRKVKEMMATVDMCTCEKCYLDVCAIILNKFKARYVTTEKGKLLSLLETTGYQFKANMTVFIMQALKTVKESPKH